MPSVAPSTSPFAIGVLVPDVVDADLYAPLMLVQQLPPEILRIPAAQPLLPVGSAVPAGAFHRLAMRSRMTSRPP